MSYLVLARKFRPQDFNAVCGQEHVTKTLMNSIRRDKVPHAILFAGPRGVGKTSIARIFAKALNCTNGPTSEPCLQCVNCKEITQGNSLAVREIDGASHNSVDNVRELIDTFRSMPPPGSKYKVYIIDEVHMLSLSAFNALLKSLEEPPPNTVFILATTETHKIPDTVVSRCQKHEFKALSAHVVSERLKEVAKAEKLDVEKEVFELIAKLSEGSMRDAQTLLDRVGSFCEGKVTVEAASKVLGVVSRTTFYKLSFEIIKNNAAGALGIIQEMFLTGVNPSYVIREFVSHWRDLFLASLAGGASPESFSISEEDWTELKRQAAGINQNEIQFLLDLAREGGDSAMRTSFPRYALESLVVRMALRAQRESTILKASRENSNLVNKELAAPIINRPQSSATFSSQSKNAVEASKAEVVPERKQSENLDYDGLVKYLLTHGHRMMAEQLKRLTPAIFANGLLKLSGAEMFVGYFKEEAKLKLQAELEKFVGGGPWRVETEVSKDLKHGVDAANAQGPARKEGLQNSISEHPKIRSLQKTFPGSTIEAIKVR